MPTSVRASGPARLIGLVLAIVIVGGSLLVAVPTAKAALTSFDVTPGQYTGTYTYVPTEVITWTITGDTAGELFDMAVIIRSTGQVTQSYDDIAMPPSLTYSTSYEVDTLLPDGNDYRIEVGDSNWVTSGRVCCRYDFQNFAVQTYSLSVEVNRLAYLGGDEVIVTWSANNLKDGSLAPDGYGQLWVYDERGPANTLITPSVHVYSEASGSYTFSLPSVLDPAWDGIVETWFNDSTSNPERYQRDFTYFELDYLGMIMDVTYGQYPPGGIVTADVMTFVTDNQANPNSWDPPEPEVDVDISVWEIPSPGSPVEQPQYGAQNLVTDLHGELTYVFQLDGDILDGADFEVRANASRGLWNWEERDTFSVSAAAGLTMVLTFNRNEYQAGDQLTVTANVAGEGTAALTYIFVVRDSTSTGCPGGGLLATDTRPENVYSYTLPANFNGRVCVYVTADDGEGNRVSSAREFSVVFGWLLVNADRQEYTAGLTPPQRITITWEKKSDLMTNPDYFYEVWDDDGNLVTSGTTGSGTSFQFAVPDPASAQYSFQVIASQDGRTIRGSVSVSEITGFFLTATFDKNSYAPGDTMRVSYRIVARGDEALPSTFHLTYGLLSGSFGGAYRTTATGSDQGTLTYVVPTGIDEGDELFQIVESNTGAMTVEVVRVSGSFSLWGAAVGDFPIVAILIVLWLLVITLVMWRRGALGGGMGAPKAPEAAPPARQEPVQTSAATPMTVTCRTCGSPIEITTSKRPIEVMCPKCGGTEVVA